ncbi:polymorphic toxin-type HINT domain-containing protein [Luedemannella helvata]|uniref:Intein C-terminal splicing domain-containing protein n=1 Tax=Luedemannella helvata TaxID=349315 RepID=A0ABN2L527_9ACTN
MTLDAQPAHGGDRQRRDDGGLGRLKTWTSPSSIVTTYSYDAASNRTSIVNNLAEPVTAVHNNEDTELVDVTVTDQATGETTTLHTTARHPFWNADKREWVDAEELTVGTHLRDAQGRATQIVTAIKVWTGLDWMRDLTVANTHTYYVLAGTTPVLVHNVNRRPIA